MAVEFTTETRPYTIDGYADAEGCTDVEFYNGGTSVVNINGRPLPVGAWWSINGFPYEKNTSRYRFNFVGGSGLLVMTRRTYKGSDQGAANVWNAKK